MTETSAARPWTASSDGASFFLAIPDSGAISYVFGLGTGPEPELHFRKRVPEARVRLLTVGPVDARRVMDVASAAIKDKPRTTWSLHCGGEALEVQRATEAGIKMMVDVVTAVATDHLCERNLPPFRASVPTTTFYFAHTGRTAAHYTIGTSEASEAVEEARKLHARHLGEAVTLYSGETPRSGELLAAMSALLSADHGFAADDKLIEEFIVPLLKGVIVPLPEGGSAGLRIRSFPIVRAGG